MTAFLGRHLFRVPLSLCTAPRPVLVKAPPIFWIPSPALDIGAQRNYAARKGTRERKLKALKAKKAAKKEKEVVTPKYLQALMMKKMRQGQFRPLFPDDSGRLTATDNVWAARFYKWPVYDLKTAIQNFKEVYHPTMFDIPTATIKAYFELNLSTKKKTQFVENVSGVLELPHIFETGRAIRTICLFCKDQTLADAAVKAGANVVVGSEGVKMFQDGSLDAEDYEVILSHPDVINDLAPIRGLISKKFPNIKKGTVGFDVVSLVKKFKNGVDYNMTPNLLDPSLGILQVPIGLVDMDSEKIEENFSAVVEGVLGHQPTNVAHSFIVKGALISEHSNERFQVCMDPYLGESETDASDDESEKVLKTSANV